MEEVKGSMRGAARLRKGYIQIYTGQGKGKTTAALGLLLRASGAGLRVYLGQFMKKGQYSEIKAIAARFPEVTVKQFGHGRFVRGQPSAEALLAAARGLGRLCQALVSGDYDVVVGDELMTVVSTGMLAPEDVIAVMERKPEHVELVLTGRGAPRELVNRADLVTEMRLVKHYMDAGVMARPGIEK